MRADRLLSILMLLQTKGRMTAHDLANQLEVSERTIYRDLEALGMAGVPIYTERGPGGGCSLIDGYQTRLTGLTEAEVRALFLINIAAPLADLGLGKALDDALLKLLAALPAPSREKAEQTRQRFHVDTTWWYHNNEVRSSFQTIQEAVWQDRKLHTIYCEDDGAWSDLLVDPYGLVAKADVWYLVAAWQSVKRVLRVSRINSAEMTEEQFVRPEDFDLASYWNEYCARSESSYPAYSVPLRLAPDEASMLPQVLGEWGYMLVESDEVLEVNGASERVIPFRRAKEKKEGSVAASSSANLVSAHHAGNQKEKKLYVLNKDGEWIVLSQQGKEKNGLKSANGLQNRVPPQKEKHVGQALGNHVNGQTQQKKGIRFDNGEGLQKKENFVLDGREKKRLNKKNAPPTTERAPLGPNQKNSVGGHIKKRLYGANQKKRFAAPSKKSNLGQTKKSRHTLLTNAHPTRQIKKTRVPLLTSTRSVRRLKKTNFPYVQRLAESNKKNGVHKGRHIKKSIYISPLLSPRLLSA